MRGLYAIIDAEEAERADIMGIEHSPNEVDLYFKKSAVSALFKVSEDRMMVVIEGVDYILVYDERLYAKLAEYLENE